MKKRKLFGHSNTPRTAPAVEVASIVKPEYEDIFFKKAGASSRNRKVVYIRKEFHERIIQIVHVIGGENTTLFEYLDNVLAVYNIIEK